MSLPNGWINCRFGDVASIRNGYAFKSVDFKTTQEPDYDVPLIRQSQLKSSIVDISDAVYLPKTYLKKYSDYVLKKGDILIGMSGSIGRVCLYDNEIESLQNQRTGKITPHSKNEISSQFFGLFLSNIERTLIESSKGVGVQNISSKDIEDLSFNLPPLNEQNRIVAKIEELFSELDQGIDNLKTAQAQLKVYRQALLKHAFEGKLTAEWRAQNVDKLESASALQHRIQHAREQRFEQQLAEWQANGKQGSKPKAPKPIAPLTAEELAELPELPEGWGYIRTGLVIDEPNYGTSKKCDYEVEGAGVLRIPNIEAGKINATDLKYASFTDDEMKAYKLEVGDILIIRSNGSISIVGQSAIISKSETEYLYAGYLIRLRPIKDLLLPNYFVKLLSSHLLRKQIELKAKSTSGVNNINSGEIQSLSIPVCSVVEQAAIVEMLELKLSEIDQLDQTITNSLQQAEALRQSILKKAFSGELVPQDPNDEAASVLLARIKAEKGKQNAIR